MVSLRKALSVMLLPMFFIGLHTTTLAQDTSGRWIPLTDDLSRADLFELVKAADLAETPLNPEEKSFTLNGPFSFPKDVVEDDTVDPPKPRANVLFGIDISHHQGLNIKFERLRQEGVRFVYVKATQGSRYIDPNFAKNWRSIASLPFEQRLFRGAYHFLSADADGVAQADSYLSFVAAGGGFTTSDLPPVVDLEWDVRKKGGPDEWAKYSPDQILQEVLLWLRKVENETGRVPMIYTSNVWWRERMTAPAFDQLSHYKIWVADYSRSSRAVETPKILSSSGWRLWQFTDSSQVASAYNSGLDADVYRGSEDQFISEFQIPGQ